MMTIEAAEQHGFDVELAEGETPFDWACRETEQARRQLGSAPPVAVRKCRALATVGIRGDLRLWKRRGHIRVAGRP
jgi:hypothetical protein